MSNVSSPRMAPTLRTTRSRANPTVTLYSLALQDTLATEATGHSSVSAQARTDPQPTSSIFLQESPAAGVGSNSPTRILNAASRKRRKIEIESGVEDNSKHARSRSSSLSSVSSSNLVDHPFVNDSVNVKLESIATPPRRTLRRHGTAAPRSPAVDATPLRVVKEEIETPLKQVQTLKRKPESKAKARPSTPIKLKLEKAHAEPPKWRRQYELIEKMRERIVAPVDTMGCETPNRERSNDPKTVRFHILISLMLSSQTKDPVTSQAVTNLHSALPGGLTAQSLASAPPEIVEACINKVGFWRRKTEYIQDAARRIVEGGLDDGEVRNADIEGIQEEPGDIPRTLNGLVKLKGVGPKMAFLALQCAWNINAGIGVDVHVHRITNRLGWHKPKTTEPEQTRLNLESWLPPHLFKPINHVLVGFGQVVCLPVGPRCDVCLLGVEKICPSRVANVNGKGRKIVEFGFPNSGEVQGTSAVKFEEDEKPLREINQDIESALPFHMTNRVEIEIETDPSPQSGAEVDRKPLIKRNPPGDQDGIQQLVEEPGMSQPEHVVNVVNSDLARVNRVDVSMVKTE